jgi:hypothetical protein
MIDVDADGKDVFGDEDNGLCWWTGGNLYIWIPTTYVPLPVSSYLLSYCVCLYVISWFNIQHIISIVCYNRWITVFHHHTFPGRGEYIILFVSGDSW